MIKFSEEKSNLIMMKNIDMLNKILGDIELTSAEKQSLIWLCGWETSTVENIISAFSKVKV